MMLLSVDEAWERVAAQACPLPVARCLLGEAAGRILAESMRAPIDLPPFDNSAMDGYAVHAADTLPACGEQPVTLPVLGEVAAGSLRAEPVAPGTAVKIMTGAALPAGADAVAMLEDGRLRNGRVELREAVPPGRHVRRQGEDVRRGEVICEAGRRLTAQRLGLLAASGVGEVAVFRRAQVAMLATGSELVPPGSLLSPGRIYDSNRVVLRTLLEQTGNHVEDLGVAPDDPARIRERVQAGLSADVLLISGGVSVGSHDHVKSVLQELSVETVFWRVNMKPGKPLFCGRRGRAWIFGLPGNPISCVVGFLVFIEPLLRLLQGEAQAGPRYEIARLTASVCKKDDRRHFLTTRLAQGADCVLEAAPTAKQGSAMMQALAQADGFVVVPESCASLDAGAMADILRIPG